MKISPINYNIHFSSSSRTLKFNDVKDINTVVKIPDSIAFRRSGLIRSNFTSFFRDDLNGIGHSPDYDWCWFRKFVSNFFKDANKVNVYSIGCSDGSEAYSCAISLIEEIGQKEAQKFFPIKAYDIDEEIIEVAKQEGIKATKHDIEKINANTKNHADKYFFINETQDKEFKYRLKRKNMLENKINFQVGDFLSILNQVEKSHTLMMCRNMWPYLDDDAVDEALDKLSNILDETSLLVVGQYDNEIMLGKKLEQYGFTKRTKNIFQNK